MEILYPSVGTASSFSNSLGSNSYFPAAIMYSMSNLDFYICYWSGNNLQYTCTHLSSRFTISRDMKQKQVKKTTLFLKSSVLAPTWMWKLGLRPRYFQKRKDIAVAVHARYWQQQNRGLFRFSNPCQKKNYCLTSC